MAATLAPSPVSRSLGPPRTRRRTIHFSAETDAETDEGLMRKVREHAAEAYPELGEEQLQGMFAQLVHDE